MGPSAFAVTVDLVVLTIHDRALRCLLVQRGSEPFQGQWALPGGFVETDEDLVDAAHRELAEETAIGEGLHLEQLGSYGTPGRDPRGPTVTVAFLGLAASLGDPVAGSDAAGASWRSVSDVDRGQLAFDHARIVADGIDRARSKLEYTSLGATLCPPEFTVAQLRAVYEAVWGRPVDPRNFHRKVTQAPGFLRPTGRTTTDGGRPAQLYRRGESARLNPPITRA
ncbi:MAG TPA: NUDIX domain-containing protein [Ornithinimicrobium sp.]|uniref:NUDIX hydrolase n=1 Tax=Ornithinimicrobium sp. TaxID=1977084 RepID=UPI002B4828A0|nr:NUDIX domain-containing protein [Ornithinimicrobium sp.]HKJ11402.1 NUDIX domain-containing protein [Ornithinimicrobium sp.]